MNYYSENSFHRGHGPLLLLLLCAQGSMAAASPLQLEMKQSHVRFVLGSEAPKLVSGLSTVPLGGLSMADEANSWRYGAAVGKIDKTTSITDLNYGAGAARAWVSTRISPSLSLEGLYQKAQGYEQLGIGWRYDFNQFGEVTVNLTQSHHGMDMYWDLNRWGKFGASYSSSLTKLGQTQHDFGLNQQFWYNSNLRIDVDAQRRTHSGDYNVGLRLYLPVF